MNEKKVREAIEVIKANYPTSGYYMLRESLDIAIEALEKQLPKKVDVWVNGTEHCPVCDKTMRDLVMEQVDWSWEKVEE